MEKARLVEEGRYEEYASPELYSLMDDEEKEAEFFAVCHKEMADLNLRLEQNVKVFMNTEFLSIIRSMMWYNCLAFFVVVFIVAMLLSIITATRRTHITLDPAYDFNPTINFTAEQLSNLRDQLSVRLKQHNAVMGYNLGNFSLTLDYITIHAGISHSTLQPIFLSPQSAGRTAQKLQGDGDKLVNEAKMVMGLYEIEKLHADMNVLTKIAATIASEMVDMEGFMKDTNNAYYTLLNRLGKALEGQPANNVTGHLAGRGQLQQPISNAPYTDTKASVAEHVRGQPLPWSWDEIDKNGTIHHNTGNFTSAQHEIIEYFLHKIDLASTMRLPANISYGIDSPDTSPKDFTTSVFSVIEVIQYPGLSTLLFGQKYTCDIVGLIAQTPIKSPQRVPDRELISIQSMKCGGEGEEKQDVIRDRDRGGKKKKWQAPVQVG